MTDDDQPAPTIPPPPGWYQDPQTGAPRWWDGSQWGPIATRPPGYAGGDVAMTVLSHLGFFMFGVLLPLIVYLTAGKTDPAVRQHSREALNFQITFLIVWIAGFIVMFGGMFAATTAVAGEPPILFFLLFFGLFGLYAAGAVCSIIGAVKAGRREPWRYPVSIRLVGRSEA